MGGSQTWLPGRRGDHATILDKSAGLLATMVGRRRRTRAARPERVDWATAAARACRTTNWRSVGRGTVDAFREGIHRYTHYAVDTPSNTFG